MNRTRVLPGVLAAFLVASNASAGLTVTAGPGGGNPAENLLFNNPDLILVGTTIQGVTNQSSSVLDIMSISSTSLTGDGGQAKVVKTGGGPFDGAMLIPHAANDLPAGLNPMASFTDLKFNIDADFDGTLSIDVFLNGSNTAMSFGPFAIDDTGQNFFRITSDGGDVITKVTLTADGDIIEKIEQIRLGGIPRPNGGNNGNGNNGNGNNGGNGEIPEPGTLLLWAVAGMTGVLGLGGRQLRRRLCGARA